MVIEQSTNNVDSVQSLRRYSPGQRAVRSTRTCGGGDGCNGTYVVRTEEGIVYGTEAQYTTSARRCMSVRGESLWSRQETS